MKTLDEMVQLLANLRPKGVEPAAYPEMVSLIATAVRMEMARKRLDPATGYWVDLDTGQPENDQCRRETALRAHEMYEARQPPGVNFGTRRLMEDGKRYYELPSDQQVKAMAAEDAARYPQMRQIMERTQHALRSGQLQVHDSAIDPNRIGQEMLRVPTHSGGEMIVPRGQVPESERIRIEREAYARYQAQFPQYAEQHQAPLPNTPVPMQVQVGEARSVPVPSWERQVTMADVMGGPSMPKPVQG